MRRATYQGKQVTPKSFIAAAGYDHRVHGRLPICSVCGLDVEVYGIRSLGVGSRFDHPDNAGPCPLADTRGGRYRHLDPGQRDPGAADALRDAFFVPGNLALAYAFCRTQAGPGALDVQAFCRLLKISDGLDIWSYRHLRLWCVPFLLLLLDDFAQSTGKQHRFRFILDKPRLPAGELWLHAEQCKIGKYFVNASGAAGNLVRAGPGMENPFAVTQAVFEALSGSHAQVSPGAIGMMLKLK